MSTYLIGQRLMQLRRELAGPQEKRWSRLRLTRATGVTLNALNRLETTGAGTIEVLQILLTFYAERGYNLSWILLADNSGVNKFTYAADVKIVEVSIAVTAITKFVETVKQQLERVEQDLRQ